MINFTLEDGSPTQHLEVISNDILTTSATPKGN